MKPQRPSSVHGRLASLALAAALLPGCAGGWRNGTPPGTTAPATTAAAPVAAPSGAPTATADGVVFRWKGEGASVALAGEFNAWNTSSDPLVKQADGSWQIVKKLEPGRYTYKFVVDGGKWEPDPNAAETVDDGYGGKNSVVVVGAADASAGTVAATAAAAGAGIVAVGAQAVSDGATFLWSGGGNTAAVAGDFNSWNTSADMMTKQADGTFRLEKKLEPGRYAYKFVIDGGTWKEDPAAKETVDDGYGGKNAILVVGAGAGTAGSASVPAAAPAAAATGAAAVGATGAAKAPVVGPDGVTFTFAGAATSVALAGDFNGWAINADMLRRQADGSWTITKKLETGSYGYKFVVNGSTWKTDDANPDSKDDGFGGKNSLVTVK